MTIRPTSAARVGLAAAVETEITLTSQPRLVELEYRIISASKAGESEPSNTVMAVL